MTGRKQAIKPPVVDIVQPTSADASSAGVPKRDGSQAANSVDDAPTVPPRHALPPSVIHELRTPLTSIHGYAQVLQRTLRDVPRAVNATAVIARESVRLSEMLSLLSELSELDHGEPSAAPIEVEVGQIVEGIAQEVARRDARAHPINVTGSARAVCNPTLLSRAMLHILTNAVRYSEEGQPVTVTIGRAGTSVEILVEDAGMGIFPADDDRVYGVFERGSNAREAGIRGLGLGLYLAQQAIMQTGGHILHQATPTGGTVFRVLLPAA